MFIQTKDKVYINIDNINFFQRSEDKTLITFNNARDFLCVSETPEEFHALILEREAQKKDEIRSLNRDLLDYGIRRTGRNPFK